MYDAQIDVAHVTSLSSGHGAKMGSHVHVLLFLSEYNVEFTPPSGN